MIDAITTWFRNASSARRDLVVIAILAVPLYAILLAFDAFDVVFWWTIQHASYELEEFLALLFCLGIIAMVYGFRRLRDLRQEVAQRQKAEEGARWLARHDPLTALPNRRHFLEELDTLVGNLTREQGCALILVDLDRFKPINDLFGHRLGDEVLRVVAKRLQRLVGDNGIVARLGGDEFGILLHYINGSDVPFRLARRLVHEVPKPIPLAALSVDVGVSVGAAVVSPERSSKTRGAISRRDRRASVELALRQADMALYRAKLDGRGRYRFHDSDMDESLQQRVQLEREIKGAIAKGEIVPYYQPLIDLKTAKAVGYEVLARWRHPERGVLAPALFIPIAEDTGSIADLTCSLLARAVEDAKSWPDELLLSINLSPRQFADFQLPQKILGILEVGGFGPRRLQVEITETAGVQSLDEAKTILQKLRDVGVRIALDDFGTGYSGLYHLRDLQLDSIKIDRSFISQMVDKPEEDKIVEAMISLAHTLGLQITAEGIESEEVLARLIELGCDTGQGFLFGAPDAEAEHHAGDVAAKNARVVA
jgi:diguanylate cyclase (GGDEF)-like protein